MLPGFITEAWAALRDWFDLRGYYTASERAVIRQLARVINEHPEKPENYLELADFHQARSDFERAARVLGRMPVHIRSLTMSADARAHVLREGMRRLVQIVTPGLTGMRVGQAAARIAPGKGHMISLHDVMVEELLEVREVLLELRRGGEQGQLELRYLRAGLPDWRLTRFLDRETARHRPDLKDFRVRMEGERVRVRCDFKGIPLRLHAIPQVVSTQTVRVRFDPSPKLFWVVPIPRRELEKALEALAAAAPEGFITSVSSEGFDLNFAPLFAPLEAVLNLRHVEAVPGEVRVFAEAFDPKELLALPGTPALLEQATRPGTATQEALALVEEAAALEPAAAEVAVLRRQVHGTGSTSASLVAAQAARALPAHWTPAEVPAKDSLAARARNAPFEPSVYKELARRYHAAGKAHAARTAFEAYALFEPGDREATEYIKTAASRLATPPPLADNPGKLDWLRCAAERREPASRVFRALTAELGWTRRSPWPADTVPMAPASAEPLLTLHAEVCRTLGSELANLFVVEMAGAGVVPGPDFIAVPSTMQGRLERAERDEAAFLLGRAVGHRMLGHTGLLDMPADDQAVLAGLVLQLGPAWYPGSHRFRPVRTLETWFSRETIANLREPCMWLAGEVETEIPIWLAAHRFSADRAGLVACGSLRAAASALLGSGGGPRTGQPLPQLLAVNPDHTLRERFYALLPFAVLDLHQGAA